MDALSLVSFPVFLVVLNSVVFVHELGHFLAARWRGVHVEEFALGFPPRLVGLVRDDAGRWRWFFGPRAPVLKAPRTIYSLNLLPIGGFVRPQGEDDPGITGGLSAASKRTRFAVLFAGPLFNLLFAVLIYTVGFTSGWPEVQTDRVLVSAMVEDAPAYLAGVRQGDALIQLDGQAVTSIQQVSEYIHSHLGQPIRVVFERSGVQQTVDITPRTEWPSGQGPTGVQLSNPYLLNRYSLGQAVLRSGREIYAQFDALVHLPSQLMQRQTTWNESRPIGFVGMSDLTRLAVSAAQRENAAYPILQLIGMINVALAITNLLPLPALDGGRIVFVLLEAVRGRRMDPAREGMVHVAGLLVLLVLMVFITYQDIVNPLIPR